MELSEHEQALAPLLTPENRPLLNVLSEAERKSLAKYVTPDNVAAIQAAIGTDEEIEAVLFWDKGGKFDDPEWQVLEPVDEAAAELMTRARAFFQEKKKEAVEYQRRSDLTLLSQFNPGLLFTGLVGAIRCDEMGRPDPAGGCCFKGVQFRMVGSVADEINSLTIVPRAKGGFDVLLGAPDARGVRVDMGDPFSVIQVLQLVGRDLSKADLDCGLYDENQNEISFDLKSVRKTARKGEEHGVPPQGWLHSAVSAEDPDQALQAAENMARVIYKRLGLETEITKIGRKYGNFFLARNENLGTLFKSNTNRWRGVVFLTATLECRRCRREMPLFYEMAQKYPDVKFALVNMNAPHAVFHERVFGDIAGGDPNRFVETAEGVTPFTIVYAPDENGELVFRDYLATGKEEKPPSAEDVLAMLEECFPGT